MAKKRKKDPYLDLASTAVKANIALGVLRTIRW
jgi:hypothetical protein